MVETKPGRLDYMVKTELGGLCGGHKTWWIMWWNLNLVDYMVKTKPGGLCDGKRTWWIMWWKQNQVDYVVETKLGGFPIHGKVVVVVVGGAVLERNMVYGSGGRGRCGGLPRRCGGEGVQWAVQWAVAWWAR